MPQSDTDVTRVLTACIEREVTAVCKTRGWEHQLRRRWASRRTPVWETVIDDYEWKLFPDGRPHSEGSAGEPESEFEEGVYYVLSYDSARDLFVLQHDTVRAGAMGRTWLRTSKTEIQLQSEPSGPLFAELRDHLFDLVEQFGPNTFSFI